MNPIIMLFKFVVDDVVESHTAMSVLEDSLLIFFLLCFNGVFDAFVSLHTAVFLTFNTLILFLLLSSRASDFHISHISNFIELT